MKKIECLVIGSTKIAKIHIRELIRNNINRISLVSRKKSKSKDFANELSKEFKLKFKNFNHTILKSKKFDLISICSNTKYHINNLTNIPKYNKKILIEKPIFHLNRKTNIFNVLDKIYKKHKNIFVSYPMYYFAKSFVNKFKFKEKKIKSIKIYYQTKGKHQSRDIFLDLAPHAFAFILAICREKNFKKFILDKLKLSKKKVKIIGKINNTNFDIIFIEDINKKKSVFKFSVNDINVKRITKIEKNKFINYLQLKNKVLPIQNPMKQVVRNFAKNQNSNSFKKNKELTYLITEITKKIYDKSFNTIKSSTR